MIRADKKQWKQVIQKHEADLQPLSNYDHIFSTSLSPPQLYTARPRFISEHVSAGQQRSRHESDLASSLSDIDTHEGEVEYVDAIPKRTLFDLRCVLSESFPDYDYSDIKSDAFSLIPTVKDLISLVDGVFTPTINSYSDFKMTMWSTIDDKIKLEDCKIYSYTDDHSGPFGEDGVMWSLNYFFCNKSLKRVLFFSCRAINPSSVAQSVDDGMWECD
uniref:Repressor of RNA polymerase III transcription MAF1 homolog n=1 Tax=Syphacia muris TaxID=451379 RepID=A0A0N5AS52_9BILA